jgi:DUF2997 family protein
MSQQIEVVIDPKGQVRLETRGCTGPACQQASRFLEQALGQAVSEQLTAEFHQAQEQQADLRQGQ